MPYPARHISVTILKKPQDVYAFLSNPLNLPKWAAGLSGSELTQEGEFWVTDSPMGKVKVKFCPANQLGVVDHDVTLPSGEVNHNPLRVLANGDDGSEVVFTLYRLPRMSDEDFQNDAKLIATDLATLKSLLESAT